MAETIVSIKDLSFSYGSKEVLKNINLEIEEGKVLGIVGPNGGGKTTLLKIILGLLKGYTGEVKKVCTFKKLSRNIHHICMGYVPQKSKINLRFPATVYDTVEMGLYGLTGIKGPSSEEKDYINWLLKEAGVDYIKDRSINEISGGQLQRTLIARALVTQPALLILDEPLVGIDQAGVSKFIELLLTLKERLNLTVVLVSHDLQAIMTCSDQIACLNKTIHLHDNAKKFKAGDLEKIYACGYDAYQGVDTFIHGDHKIKND